MGADSSGRKFIGEGLHHSQGGGGSSNRRRAPPRTRVPRRRGIHGRVIRFWRNDVEALLYQRLGADGMRSGGNRKRRFYSAFYVDSSPARFGAHVAIRA